MNKKQKLGFFRQFTVNNLKYEEYGFRRELAMEAYLFENPDILNLDDSNFTDADVLAEEIALKKGGKSGDGRIDLLVKYSDEYLGIVELKLNQINLETLRQLENYLEQRHQILEVDQKEYWGKDYAPKWVGILAGSSISPELQEKLMKGYKFGDIPIAGIVIQRFKNDLRNEIYVISDTYFKYNYTTKDYSKFFFDNEEYNKGKLVHAVIKKYVSLFPDISFDELKSKFPDNIQGSHGVFSKFSKAKKVYEESGRKRYYINEDEVIRIKNELISTCNQWNPNNIQSFIKKAAELDLIIEIQ